MLINIDLSNNVRSIIAHVLDRRSNNAVTIINQIIVANDTTIDLINLKLAKINNANATS